MLITFFQNLDIFGVFNENKVRQLLPLTRNESHFIFNEIFYKQIDGMSMGFSLEYTFSNDF